MQKIAMSKKSTFLLTILVFPLSMVAYTSVKRPDLKIPHDDSKSLRKFEKTSTLSQDIRTKVQSPPFLKIIEATLFNEREVTSPNSTDKILIYDLALTLENVSIKEITGFTVSLGKKGSADFSRDIDLIGAKTHFGASQRYSHVFKSIPETQTISISSVIFLEDSFGDKKQISRILSRRAGRIDAFKKTGLIFEQMEQFPNNELSVRIDNAISDLKKIRFGSTQLKDFSPNEEKEYAAGFQETTEWALKRLGEALTDSHASQFDACRKKIKIAYLQTQKVDKPSQK